MSLGVIASSATDQNGGGGNSPYTNALLQDNPELFLLFDETSGTTAADFSGNGRDGTYSGPIHLGQFPVISNSHGHSVRAETGEPGGYQYVSIPDGAWMDTPEMTIAFPCFIVPGGLTIIAARYTEPGTDWSWFVYQSGGTFRFIYRSSGGVETTVDSGVTIVQGKRYYIAAYVNATECGIRVYDQAGLLGSATGAGGVVNPSGRNMTLFTGDTGAPYPTTGYIDNFAFLSQALTPGRLDTLANLAIAANAVTWINRGSAILPRNGTSLQTIPFTATSTGSLVVIVASAPTGLTANSPGWTQRLNANGDTGLVVLTRNTNPGETSMDIALFAPDWPLAYTVFEFPSGSSWVTGNYTESNVSLAFEPLTGLPGGGATVFAAGSKDLPSGDSVPDINWWYFWTTDTDQGIPYDGSKNGIYLQMGYFVDMPVTTADIEYPSPQLEAGYTGVVEETVMFAIATP